MNWWGKKGEEGESYRDSVAGSSVTGTGARGAGGNGSTERASHGGTTTIGGAMILGGTTSQSSSGLSRNDPHGRSEPLTGVRAAITSGTSLKGRLSFDAPIRIDGLFCGELFSSALVIVGEQGVFLGTLQARELWNQGNVSGTVAIRERATLKAGARFDGEISAESLAVEEGAFLNATVSACTAMNAAPVRAEVLGALSAAGSESDRFGRATGESSVNVEHLKIAMA